MATHILRWRLFLVAAVGAVSADLAAAPSASAPPSIEILKTLRPNHPRLLLSESEFALLPERVRGDSLLASWATKLAHDAEEILVVSPAEYARPDGVRLLDVGRQVKERVLTLALAYRLTGNRQFADRAWNELEAAGGFPDWNPSHFLDTAEMTAVFALAYDWLFEVWTPEQQAFLRRAIVEMGLRPAWKRYQNRTPRGWPSRADNWNLVCNGGIGLGALAVAEWEPELAGAVLDEALRSVRPAMREFAPEGAWPEGPHYWLYGTTYNVLLLAALESALGTDFGLTTIPGFAACGRYAIHVQGPTGDSYNYSDAVAQPIHAPQMLWLARVFNQPWFAARQLQIAGPEPLDLVYLSQNPPRGAIIAEPLDAWFRRAEFASFRGDWTDPDATWIGFKAGDNKASHSHLDLGSFVLEALGTRWAVDPGRDDYNLPGYFGDQRWDYYRLRAEGHNTLVINPGPGPDQDPSAAAPIVRFASRPDYSFAIADLSAAYARDAHHVRRGIALRQRKEVLVEDEWRLRRPGEVWWFLHTEARIELGAAGSSAMLSESRNRMAVRILSPTGATFSTRSAEPLPDSPHPMKQASNKGSVLCIRIPGTKEARLAVLFRPLVEGESEPASRPAVAPLESW